MRKFAFLTGIALLTAIAVPGQAIAQSSTPAFCDSYEVGPAVPQADWKKLCKALNNGLGDMKMVVTEVQLQTTYDVSKCATYSYLLKDDVPDPWNDLSANPLEVVHLANPSLGGTTDGICANGDVRPTRENGPPSAIGAPGDNITQLIAGILPPANTADINSLVISVDFYADQSYTIPTPVLIATSKPVGCTAGATDCNWTLTYYDYLCGPISSGEGSAPNCPRIVKKDPNPNGWASYYIHNGPNPPQGAARTITVTYGYDAGIGGPQEVSWTQTCQGKYVQGAKLHFADPHSKHICHCLNVSNGQCP